MCFPVVLLKAEQSHAIQAKYLHRQKNAIDLCKKQIVEAAC